MRKQCYFCWRWCRNRQAVRRHLRDCAAYEAAGRPKRTRDFPITPWAGKAQAASTFACAGCGRVGDGTVCSCGSREWIG